MSEQQEIGRVRSDPAGNFSRRKRAELAIQQGDVVTVIDERAADRKQSQWRQMVIRNAAADRRVRRIDDQDSLGCRTQSLEPLFAARTNGQLLNEFIGDGPAHRERNSGFGCLEFQRSDLVGMSSNCTRVNV